MSPETSETLRLHTSEDIVRVRQLVRARAIELHFSLIDQTKIVTAASEIARNTIQAGGGQVRILEIISSRKNGLRLEFSDTGPGIADIDQAMRDGFTTTDGLGLGLGGARRLVDEFGIESKVGKGTQVTLLKWNA